jgi:toxin CptA
VPKKKVYLASVLGQFIPVVWLGVLGASLATNSGEVDPGKLIVQNFGVLALPVLLMVLHGPIATNILNIYTFSVATQALDISINRRKLNLFVGIFSLAAVVFFIFQENFAAVLDAWLIGLVAWVAAWGGVMLVHYFWLEKRWPGGAERLFDGIGTRRLPAVNWAGVTSLLAGIFATWLFMYGLIPVMQGPIAVALGGWDLSWLAGGLTSAGVYAVLGPRVHVRYVTGKDAKPAQAPETTDGAAAIPVL